MAELNEDVILACASLVGRCGASSFEMAWTCPHVPDGEDGHTCPEVTWNASAAFRGARIVVEGRFSPSEAAMALAERLLTNATCRCRRGVSLSDSDGNPGCRWRLVGKEWQPGCDVEPLHVKGTRGDMDAMRAALAEPMSRRDRRKAKRHG